MEQKRFKVAIALALFFTIPCGLLVYWLMTSISDATGIVAITVLVVLSLVVALVLGGVLRATGVFKDSSGTYQGAAAIFFGCFTTSYVAYLQMPERSTIVEVSFINFPDDVSGTIEVQGGCRETFPAGTLSQKLDLHGECRKDQLNFTISTDGNKPFIVGPIGSATAVNQGVRIEWAGTAKPRFVGVVTSAQTKSAVKGVNVMLVGCADVAHDVTDDTGSFALADVPSRCITATPEVAVEHAGRTTRARVESNKPVEIVLEGALVSRVVAGDQFAIDLDVTETFAQGIYEVHGIANDLSTKFLWNSSSRKAVRASATGSNADVVALQSKPVRLDLLSATDAKAALLGRIEDAGTKPAALSELSTWLIGSGPAEAEVRAVIAARCLKRVTDISRSIVAEQNPTDAPGFCARFSELDSWKSCAGGAVAPNQSAVTRSKNLNCKALAKLASP